MEFNLKRISFRLYPTFLILLFGLLTSTSLFGQVKIGDDTTHLSPYSLLELESINKGLLLPRMSSEQRDQAFNQNTPEGMVIFNTDLQMLQFFFYPNDSSTGKRLNEKVWNTAGEEVYSIEPPVDPNPGDLFYNHVTNVLYVWDEPEKLWIPINTEQKVSTAEEGVPDPTITTSGTIIGGDESITSSSTTVGLIEVLTGDGFPSSVSGITKIDEVKPGLLYVNTRNGDLYTAADTNSDGVSDKWDKVTSSGGGGGGGSSNTDNQTLTISGTTLSITGGNSVNLSGIGAGAGAGVAQTLSIAGNNLSISGGNSVSVPGITTTLTQSTTTGVIEYTNETGTIVSATVISGHASNILRAGVDGGAYLDSSLLSAVTVSQTTTALSQTASGVITYLDENLNTTTVTTTSLEPSNLLEISSVDNGTLLTSTTLSNALQTVSSTIAQIVSSTLTSATIQALETTTTFTQSTTTGVIEYTDEDGLTVSATIISAQVSNILEVGSDGGTYLNRAALSITDSQTLTVTSTIATATGSQSETVEIALENSSNASYTIDLSSLEEVTSATVTPASYTFTKSPTVGDLFVDTTSSTLWTFKGPGVNDWVMTETAVENIYTDDGTLTATRTVNLDGNWLQFTDTASSILYIDPTDDRVYIGNNITFAGTASYTASLGVSDTADLDLVVEGDIKSRYIVDENNEVGNTGEVLTKTATGVDWKPSGSVIIETITSSAGVSTGTTLLLIEPSADMTLTMPVAGSTVFPAGYTLKIKRNQTYTGTADKITIDASAANASIDGTTTKYMNVGYQSFTVVATSSGWVTID